MIQADQSNVHVGDIIVLAPVDAHGTDGTIDMRYVTIVALIIGIREGSWGNYEIDMIRYFMYDYSEPLLPDRQTYHNFPNGGGWWHVTRHLGAG